MATRKADDRVAIEQKVQERLEANRNFCDDLSAKLHISSELVGNAVYHTSLTTDQSVLEILATVRTFHIWLEKVQEVKQGLWQDKTEEEQKSE